MQLVLDTREGNRPRGNRKNDIGLPDVRTNRSKPQYALESFGSPNRARTAARSICPTVISDDRSGRSAFGSLGETRSTAQPDTSDRISTNTARRLIIIRVPDVCCAFANRVIADSSNRSRFSLRTGKGHPIPHPYDSPGAFLFFTSALSLYLPAYPLRQRV
jgi:hypothetical protein